MGGGEKLYQTADVVRHDRHIIKLGQIGNFAHARNATDKGNVGMNHMHSVIGQKLKELCHQFQFLARHYPHGRRPFEGRPGCRVGHGQRVFNPKRLDRRHCFCNPQRGG